MKEELWNVDNYKTEVKYMSYRIEDGKILDARIWGTWKEAEDDKNGQQATWPDSVAKIEVVMSWDSNVLDSENCK